MATDRTTGGVGIGWLIALMAANTVAAVGLFGDIARHVTLVGTVEDDFLAGWHLVLYGGVAGVAAVLGALAVARGPWYPWRHLASACAGLACLTVGGLTDAVWHEVFGVEASFQALVSPPHLVVLAGLVLLMVAPIDAVADGPTVRLDPARSLVLALSVTSMLLVVSLFTGYLTPLIGGSELQAGYYTAPLVATSPFDQDIATGLGVTLWFGALVAFTVVVVRGRAAPVPGTWTVAFGLLGVAPWIASGSPAIPLLPALLAYGVASDFVGARGRPHPVSTGACVAVMWAVLLAVIDLRGDLMWDRELVTGVIVTGFLVGSAVGGAFRWVATPARVLPRKEVDW